MNYMVDRMELNDEQVLWLCFLYGVTYHLPSAYLLWNEYPDLELIDDSRLRSWWVSNQKSVPFQKDKMKQRPKFVETVLSYKKFVSEGQKSYFDSLLSGSPYENFDKLWNLSSKDIKFFGRFSIWNWSQALKHVAGYNIESKRLMLGEKDSISFTDGLAYAFSYPDRVTKKMKNSEGKTIKKVYLWTEAEKEELEYKCKQFKQDLNIDNFQLETLACAYKKVWRTHESRYVGYYNDRIANDILSVQSSWCGVDWQLLWDARKQCVPKRYLHDTGVDKSKFLLTPEQKISL